MSTAGDVMSDRNFQKQWLSNVLVITKTTQSGHVPVADITSGRLLIECEKLAQAVDEFPKTT